MDLMTIADYLWLAVLAFWIISRFTVKQAVQREELGWRTLHLTFVITTIALTFIKRIPYLRLETPILPQSDVYKLCGFIVCVLGLSFAVWARIILGRNWSGRITIKEDHEFIDHGPYALARHPIYTGLITGFTGSAMMRGEVRGYIAMLLIIIAYSIKINREENVLRIAFGERYIHYSKKVKRLIPFIY